MPDQTHHFFAFRHCPRSTHETLDLGLGDDYTYERKDYTASRPDYGVDDMQCTETGVDLVKATGKWLIDSGTIEPGSKIQWEIIADDSQRDIDSARAMFDGIQQGLAHKKHHQTILSVHDESVRVDTRFSGPQDLCDSMENISDEKWIHEVRARLHQQPRPEISFADALDLLQSVAGKGDVGDLTSYVPHGKPHFDEDTYIITGAPSLLSDLGADMFLSRAGAADPVFGPDASQSDVFQLYQFHSWYRSILNVGNSWEAANGAAQVQAMLQTLRDGYYMTNHNDADYDTRVTLVFGHDTDLNRMATAMGAQWILKPPYISGPGGAFLETPPTSGIHAKRNLETDRVDLSFVYPNYALHPSSDSFELNMSGELESAPLLFYKGRKEIFETTETSVYIESSSSDSSPLDLLEDHMNSVMSEYFSTDCFEEAAAYWKNNREIALENDMVSDEFPPNRGVGSSTIVGGMSRVAIITLEVLGGMIFLCVLWKVCYSRHVQRRRQQQQQVSLEEEVQHSVKRINRWKGKDERDLTFNEEDEWKEQGDDNDTSIEVI